MPKHPWDELKVEADIGDRHVDSVEVRPPWDGLGEHTRFPIARLRCTQSTGRWAVYWRDRNLKFHEYKRKRPTRTSKRSSIHRDYWASSRVDEIVSGHDRLRGWLVRLT